MTEIVAHGQLDTPIGPLLLRTSAEGVLSITFMDQDIAVRNAPRRAHRTSDPAERMLHRAVVELGAYFDGELSVFSAPIIATGSEFQRTVWSHMRSIPLGATLSYGELAREAGSPGAARAVGAACACNPVPIMTPCHRVVASDGSLHGFAGGLWRKEWLLNHERAHIPKASPAATHHRAGADAQSVSPV